MIATFAAFESLYRTIGGDDSDDIDESAFPDPGPVAEERKPRRGPHDGWPGQDGE